MWKMGLVQNAIKSNHLLRNSKLNQCLASLARQSPRHFSTEAEQSQHSSPDPLFQTPPTGLTYGRLACMNKYTLKTDIISLLDGCNLTLDDVKFQYDRNFAPVGIMVQFPSRYAYDHGFRLIGKKGRLYKFEMIDRSLWDAVKPYNGKAVLLQGVPRNATPDDIDRFLSGCEYDASSVQTFFRMAFPDDIKMAVVHFPSQTQAMNAFIAKNRGFCLNNQIWIRVLQ